MLYFSAPKIIKLATFLARYRYLPYEMVERIFLPEFLDNAEKMTYFGNDTPKITFHYKMGMYDFIRKNCSSSFTFFREV